MGYLGNGNSFVSRGVSQPYSVRSITYNPISHAVHLLSYREYPWFLTSFSNIWKGKYWVFSNFFLGSTLFSKLKRFKKLYYRYFDTDTKGGSSSSNIAAPQNIFIVN